LSVIVASELLCRLVVLGPEVTCPIYLFLDKQMMLTPSFKHFLCQYFKITNSAMYVHISLYVTLPSAQPYFYYITFTLALYVSTSRDHRQVYLLLLTCLVF